MMKKLNKNELTLLGDSFLHLAQAVGAYRIENYKQLSPKMKVRIRAYHKSLIDYADTFYAASTSFIVEDAASSIANIQQISLELKDIIKKVKKVQNVLNTMGAATRLGAAILSKQPIALAESLKEFMASFKDLKTKTLKK
jgi:hypothetical protein